MTKAEQVIEEFRQKFCVDCVTEDIAVVSDYKGITKWLRTTIAEVEREARREGYAEGFMNGAEKGFSKDKPILKGE